ncbi:MAG TPA: hypothetical protein VFF65_10760 [Phycisphaerales bacterium]|nr:hypothetical protein [Phycisphaerales bacterium]
MSRASSAIRVAYLFVTTILRRVVLTLLGYAPPEAADLNGNYRTLAARRRGSYSRQERDDFAAVKRDLRARGKLRHERRMVIATALQAVVVSMMIALAARSGWPGLWPAIATPVVAIVIAVAGGWWWKAQIIDADENEIAAAWLRLGNCPHCAYRLPPGLDDAASVRCTECGIPWPNPAKRVTKPSPDAVAAR